MCCRRNDICLLFPISGTEITSTLRRHADLLQVRERKCGNQNRTQNSTQNRTKKRTQALAIKVNSLKDNMYEGQRGTYNWTIGTCFFSNICEQVQNISLISLSYPWRLNWSEKWILVSGYHSSFHYIVDWGGQYPWRQNAKFNMSPNKMLIRYDQVRCPLLNQSYITRITHCHLAT